MAINEQKPPHKTTVSPESFFATLECELLDHRKFKTEARMAILGSFAVRVK